MSNERDIPDEYWPRCEWCGRLLKEGGVSHESALGKCTICPVCCSMVGELVKRWAPGWIGEALSNVEDGDEPPYFRTLGSDEIIEKACSWAETKGVLSPGEFYQTDGIVVGEGVTFANMQGYLKAYLEGKGVETSEYTDLLGIITYLYMKDSEGKTIQIVSKPRIKE